MVSHWQSNDEIQVAMDWSSSGMGSTVKWCHIGSLIKIVQVTMDWSSNGRGLTVKWCHIGSLMIKVKWQWIGLQVVWDRQSSGATLAV